MESYIEVTWLSGFFTLMHASTLAFYLANKPCFFWRMVGYSAVIPLLACLLFHRLEWVAMGIAEAIFAYAIFHHAWKGWLLMMAHRLLLHLSAYLLYGGSFHLGIWFVPSDTLPLLYWITLMLSWTAMFFHFKYTLSKQDFIYPIEIAAKESIRTKGYLDSGNLTMSEGIPVMFLDQHFETYFDASSIQWVMADTMNGSGRLACHPAKVRIANAPYHNVLICCKGKLSLPLGAKALLNIHMMTQE